MTPLPIRYSKQKYKHQDIYHENKYCTVHIITFKEQSTLSLVASALKEVQAPAEDIIFSVGTAGLSLMKSAVVYGANASGKSNFIKAFGFFKWYVINSSKDIQAGERVNIENFRLNSVTAGEP